MRFILPLLLLFTTQLNAELIGLYWSGRVPFAASQPENSYSDGSGKGNGLIPNFGMVPTYDSSIIYEGSYSATSFGCCVPENNTVGLGRAITTTGKMRFESYFYFSNLSTEKALLTAYTPAPYSKFWYAAIKTDGAPQITNGVTSMVSGVAGTVVAGRWYYMSFEAISGTSTTLYISGVTETPKVSVSTTSEPFITGFNMGLQIGRRAWDGLALCSNCYFDSFAISNDTDAERPHPAMRPFQTKTNVSQKIPDGTIAYRPMNNATSDVAKSVGKNMFPVALNTIAPAYVLGPGNPPGGGYSTGPYSAGSGTSWVEQAAMRTLFGGLTEWSVEFDVYSSDYSNQPVLSMFGTNGDINNWWAIQAVTGGAVKVYANTSFSVTGAATGLFPTNTWTHVAWEREGNEVRAYVCPSDSSTTTTAVTFDVTGRTQTNIPTFQYGNYYLGTGNNFNGYMKNFQISTKAYKRYPSVSRLFRVVK